MYVGSSSLKSSYLWVLQQTLWTLVTWTWSITDGVKRKCCEETSVTLQLQMLFDWMTQCLNDWLNELINTRVLMNEFAHIHMYGLINILYKIYTNHKTRIRFKTSDRWTFINIFNMNTTNVYRRVREVAKSNYWHRLVCPSVSLPARPPAWNDSAPTGRIFMKLGIWDFFETLSRKCKFHYIRTRITGTLRQDQCTIFLIFRSVLPRIRNVSHKNCKENQNTDFVFSNFFFLENRAVYKIMRKSSVARGRPQMTIWRTCVAYWIPKATNTHPQAV